MEKNDVSESNRFEKAKKKLIIIYIISSIVIDIIFVFSCKYVGSFQFVSIAKENSNLFSELLGYSFVYIVFYGLYYAFLAFILLVEWHIISSRNKDFYTGNYHKSFYGLVRSNDSKYNKELDYIYYKLHSIITLVEYSIIFLLFMFGVIAF